MSDTSLPNAPSKGGRALRPSTWFRGSVSSAEPGLGLVVTMLMLLVLWPVMVITTALSYTAGRIGRSPWWVPLPIMTLGSILIAVVGGAGVFLTASADLLGSLFGNALVNVVELDQAPMPVVDALAGWLVYQTPLGVLTGSFLAFLGLGWLRLRRPVWREEAEKELSPAQRRKNEERLHGARESIAESVPLGMNVDTGQIHRILETSMGAHALVSGATGAGKTVTMMVLAQADIRRGRPVVVLDMKGSPSLIKRLAAECRIAKRRLRVFTIEGKYQTGYHLLARGDASQKKDLLVSAEQWTEPHYKGIVENWTQMVFKVLSLPGAREWDGPLSLAEVVDAMDPETLWSCLDAAALAGTDVTAACNAVHSIVPRSPDGKIKVPSDVASSVGSMRGKLSVLTQSTAGPWLSPWDDHGRPTGPIIDLGQAIEDGDVVCFSLDAQAYPETAARIGGFVVADLISVASQLLNNGNEVPARLYLDEFGALGRDSVLNLLARSREAGMSVVLSFQDLGDLRKVSETLPSQVLANTAVKIVHSQRSDESAVAFSKLAGTYTGWQERLAIEHASGLPGTDVGAATGTGFVTEEEKDVLEVTRIMRLEQGQAAVLTAHPETDVSIVQIIDPGPTADLQPGTVRLGAAPTSTPLRRTRVTTPAAAPSQPVGAGTSTGRSRRSNGGGVQWGARR